MSLNKGIWFNGSIDNVSTIAPYNPVGMQLILEVNEIELSEGVYNWSDFDAAAAYCSSHNMQMIIRISINQSAPAYVLSASGSYVTTGHPLTGPYPYQVNPVYQSWVNTFWGVLIDKIKSINILHPGLIIAWAVSTGTTGDKGFYKGTLSGYNYLGDTTFDNSEQNSLEKTMWSNANILKGSHSLPIPLLLNSGNDGEDKDFIDSSYPGSYMKSGETSHNILPVAEATLAQRNCIDSGEIQSIFSDSDFAEAYAQHVFVLFASIRALNLDFPLIPQGLINSAPSGGLTAFNNAMTWGSKYFGRKSSDKLGVVVLRDAIDFLDDGRFTEAIHGDVIDPARYGPGANTYLNRLSFISGAGYDPTQEAYELIVAKKDFINPDRITSIMASVASTGATYSEVNIHDNDTGYDLLKNYEFNIEQYQPDTSSYGVYRVGNNLSDTYGRWCRAIPDESFFKFTDTSVFADDNYGVTIKVVYKRNTNAQWALTYHNGTEQVILPTIVDVVEGDFQTRSFVISDFQGGGQLTGSNDISIIKISGTEDPVIQSIGYESVTNSDSLGCVDVSILSDTIFHDGQTNLPYNVDIDLGGDAPFTLTNIVKPDWMTIEISGSQVLIGGTPTSPESDINVSFDVENCSSGSVSINETFSVLDAIEGLANIFLLPSGPLNLSSLFPSINWSNIDEYYLEAIESGEVVATSNVYKSGCCCGVDNGDKVRIHFLNYCNTYDGIDFVKRTVDHDTVDSSFQRSLSIPFDTTQTGLERYNVSSNDTYSVFNDCYNEKHTRWLQELFDSPKSFIEYMAEGNRKIYLPIIILSKKIRKQDTNGIIKIELQFKLSNDFRTIRN